MFITLTMPAQHGYDALPVMIGIAHIRSLNPRRVRKAHPDIPGGFMNGGPEAHEISGTYITTGDGDEQTFPVTDDYGTVCALIHAARQQ